MKNKNLFIKVLLSVIVMYSMGYIYIKSEISSANGPLGLVIIGLPTFTFIISLAMQLLIKKKVIVLSSVFIGYLISTFVVFDNSSFIIWCFIYTFISLFGAVVADLMIKYKKKFMPV